MRTTTTDKFYNFLMDKADEIHNETWEHFNDNHDSTMSEAYNAIKSNEILMGEIIREYESTHGKPEEIKKTKIQDYIDPTNTEHMKAYLYMRARGEWPNRFKEQLKRDNVAFTNEGWKQLVDRKISEFWVRKHLRTSEQENVISGAEYGELKEIEQN